MRDGVLPGTNNAFFLLFINSLFWFQNMAYYKISHVDGRISNPEQRIASDVPRFCSELSELVQEDLTAVTDGLLYTWRLCSYTSPKYLFWILVIFLSISALIVQVFDMVLDTLDVTIQLLSSLFSDSL